MCIINVTESDISRARNKAIIGLFHKSVHSFWLTGSRYFGGATDYSDYDFFAKNCAELRAWLVGTRFTKLGTAYHPEVNHNVAEVWGNLDWGVHVQLVEDPELKHKIQLAIKGGKVNLAELTHKYGKDAVVDFWDLFYSIAKINHGPVTTVESEDMDQKVKQLTEEKQALTEENAKLRKALEENNFKSSELYDLIG